MQETGGEGQATELAVRVAQLETELVAQRDATEALRQELRSMRNALALNSINAGLPREPSASPQWRHRPPPTGYEQPAPSYGPPPQDFGPQPPPREAVTLPHVNHSPSPSSYDAVDTGTAPQRSLENRIGSQLFNRLGIIALLVGVAYFLKLAIDNHWIHTTPIGRVAMGLLIGSGVVLWSERFRRKGYGAFSYSLKAVGTGTLYLVLWASFHIYHLLPAWVALLMMIGVTAWNALMAWSQDAELLAVYALVGGFATPGLLGSGGNHAVFLFFYLLVMDLAVLLLVMKKQWQRLLVGSFPATAVYFIGWYVQYWSPSQAGLIGLFVVLLAFPMVAVALVGKQRENVGQGLLAPLAAAGFLSFALYSVLQDSGRHSWLPWIAVALAALYLLLMRVRKNGVAEAVHLALAITFLTVAIPLKAEGRWITIGWLAEGAALMWVAARVLGPEVQPRVRIVTRWMATCALALGVGESVIFWSGEDAAKALWNGRFATELSAAAALAITAWIAREAAGHEGNVRESWSRVSLISSLGTHVITAAAVIRELIAFWNTSPAIRYGSPDQLSQLSCSAFLLAYGAALLLWIVQRVPARSSRRKSLGVLATIFLVAGFFVMLVTPLASGGFAGHILFNLRAVFEVVGLFALAVATSQAWKMHTDVAEEDRGWRTLAAACGIAFNLIALFMGVREILAYFYLHAGGDSGLAESFTISAWLMVCAALLMGAGFWRRLAFIRWQGLALVIFTIGKVCLYDMRDLNSGYRVMSIVALGVLLMAVSFAYQKDWLGLRDDLEAKP